MTSPQPSTVALANEIAKLLKPEVNEAIKTVYSIVIQQTLRSAMKEILHRDKETLVDRMTKVVGSPIAEALR
jgi:hypothetical protein